MNRPWKWIWLSSSLRSDWRQPMICHNPAFAAARESSRGEVREGRGEEGWGVDGGGEGWDVGGEEVRWGGGGDEVRKDTENWKERRTLVEMSLNHAIRRALRRYVTVVIRCVGGEREGGQQPNATYVSQLGNSVSLNERILLLQLLLNLGHALRDVLCLR